MTSLLGVFDVPVNKYTPDLATRTKWQYLGQKYM